METTVKVPAGSSRFMSLKQDLTRRLSQALTSMDFEVFQGIFEGFEESEHIAFFDLYRQVLYQIRLNSEAEFDEIAADAGLWDKLLAIEELEEQQAMLATNRVAPADVARSCRVQAKRQEVEALQAILKQAAEERDAAEEARNEQQALVSQATALYKTIPETLQQVDEASKQWAARDPIAS